MKVKRLRKVVALALSAMLCIGAVGCAKDVSSSADAAKTEIVYASTKDIMDINPHLYTGEMAAQNMVFESLVTINNDGEIEPCLATSWEISEDGLEYTFKLREDVTFTDEEKFNADAVKQNFDAVLSNFDRHAWLELVNQIDKTEVVDEYTFKMTLKKAYYPSLTELALTRPFRMISPKCFIDGETKNGVNGYAGTGRFVLSEHEDDQYAVFTRNDNYWGDKAKVESVKWTVMPDTETMLLALENGEIDLIYGADGDQINADSYKNLIETGEYETAQSNPTAARAILLNSASDITKDVKVRKALQHAADNGSIVEGVLNGLEKEADTLLPTTTPYCDVEQEIYDYNKDKAAKLLEEAGWKLESDGYRHKDGKLLELDFYYNSDNAQEGTISEYLQGNFKEVGVKLNVTGEETQSVKDRQKSGDFDLLYSLSWGTPYDPQSYVSSWRQPAHGDYQAQVGLEKKAWLDQTITDVLVEVSDKKRAQMYEEIFSYIADQAVYLPISYSTTKSVYSSKLKGIEFLPSQYEIPFEKMYFEETK